MPSSGAASSRAIGAKAGALRPEWRSRSLVWLARRFGPQFVLPTLSTLEQRDVGSYDSQPEAVAGGLPAAERSHNRVVQALASSFPGGAAGGTLARIEGRHRAGGNALRAAVLGANDGLVSNFSLVMGVAGARDRRQDDPAHRPCRADCRRLLDGDRRVAVGHQLARTEPATDRPRGRRARSRRRKRKKKNWC